MRVGTIRLAGKNAGKFYYRFLTLHDAILITRGVAVVQTAKRDRKHSPISRQPARSR